MQRILFVLFLINYFFVSFGQGCSDAGFCTVSANKPDLDSANYKNQLKSAFFIGKADHNIFVYGAYLEYNRAFTKVFAANVKVTSLGQSGKEANLFNVSDAFFTSIFTLKKTKLNVGIKLPMNNGNRTLNGNSLPMDYQSSLGTTDLIVGYKFPIKKFTLVGAFQQPITQNKNTFLTENYLLNTSFQNFQPTNKYQRKGDVLLRISRPIELSENCQLTPSILSIYHLGEDYYTNFLNQKTKIVGSEGLTMNANVYLDYSFNPKNSLQMNVGIPFVVRPNRPDGLTRSFICNLEYIYQF